MVQFLEMAEYFLCQINKKCEGQCQVPDPGRPYRHMGASCVTDVEVFLSKQRFDAITICLLMS